MNATATPVQAAVARALGEPARHFDASGGRQPLCGQVAAGGRGYARTRYTTTPSDVTCLKCRRALEAQGRLP